MTITPCDRKDCKFWQEIEVVTNFTRLERMKTCIYCGFFKRINVYDLQKDKK